MSRPADVLPSLGSLSLRYGWLAALVVLPACQSNLVVGAELVTTSDSAKTLPLAYASAADVSFSLDARKTSAISPFIYGVNGYHTTWDGADVPKNLTLSRSGGNRWSAYNWETNASNAGSDWYFQNDSHLGGGNVPGEAVRPRIQGALDRGAGVIVTVPMLGYVSADKNGPMGVDEAGLATRLATRFRESRPRKGSAFTTTPDQNDRYVYQDEFVWWVTQTFPQGVNDPNRPIMFSLDNEPDIWHETHEQVRSKVNGKSGVLGYDEMVDRTLAYAGAIKSVAPTAQVFGGVVATWSGATSLGRWPNPDPTAGTSDFLNFYLKKLRAAEQTSGQRLVDVLDVHWYSEARAGGKRVNDDGAPQTPEMARARMQSPRSLWDPTYDEKSWVSESTGGPIRLIPRLRDKIAAHYPGTKLAITEYYYGRGGDISGGIAQADVLGIFGREGVYAANLWPLANLAAYGGSGARAYAYAFGALKMFRDYDGNGGSFGDTGIAAATSDVEKSSVYASIDAQGRVVGLSEAYIPPAQGAVALGFAIPAETVVRVADELLEDGRAEHAFLGVQFGNLTPQIAEQLDVDREGALVLGVGPGGPAALAGLEPGDVLVQAGGERVRTVEDVLGVLRRTRPGERLELTVLRDGREQQLEVLVGERPV
ncbi:MAG: PDZ domain-containing protein [Gemmatimonadetes bacterium]|nr:PDZ domain-containing protein [Gemmatimonadota bacterium]